MSAVPTTEQYLERARQYYADGNAVKALNYFEKVSASDNGWHTNEGSIAVR